MSKQAEQDNDLFSEIFAVNKITAIPKILEIVCHMVGIGFAAVVNVHHNDTNQWAQ